MFNLWRNRETDFFLENKVRLIDPDLIASFYVSSATKIFQSKGKFVSVSQAQ